MEESLESKKRRLARELMDTFGAGGDADPREAGSWDGVERRASAIAEYPNDRRAAKMLDQTLVARGGPRSAKTEFAGPTSNRRSNKRFTSPKLRVLIGKSDYQSLDWSLGGVRIAPYVGDLDRNNRIPISFAVSNSYFGAKGRIIWLDRPKRILGIQFENISRDGLEFLSALQLQRTQARAGM
jgi:hypothetical protein